MRRPGRAGWGVVVRLVPVRRQRTGFTLYAQIDDDEFPRISQFSWRFACSEASGKLYATTGSGKNCTLMHRMIMGLQPGDRRQVDHRDRNQLNNQRHNLRLVNNAQNCQNQRSVPGTSSQFRGVSWHVGHQKWTAYVRFNGRQISLGDFDTEEEAALAASRWRALNMSHAEQDRQEELDRMFAAAKRR